MKPTFYTLLFSLMVFVAFGQSTIDPKGITVPRYSNLTAIQSAIPTPQTGTIVYNNATNTYYYYNGSAWTGISATSAVVNCSDPIKQNIIVVVDNTKASAFYVNPSGVGTWVSQTVDPRTDATLSSKQQVVLWGGGYAYIFSIDNNGIGSWSVRTISSGTSTSIASEKQIVLFGNSLAYASYQDCQGVAQWSQLAFTLGAPTTSIASKTQIVLFRTSAAYGFSQDANGTGSWSPTPINGGTVTSIATDNTITLVSTGGTAFGFWKGIWTHQNITGTQIITRTQ